MENVALTPLEEKKAHGDLFFPFNIYPCAIPDDFPSVALHWHRSMELIYLKRGQMLARLDMRDAQLEQGDICVVPPGTLHALQSCSDRRAEYENIIFDVGMLGSGAADVCSRKYFFPLEEGKLLHPRLLRRGEAGYERVAACLERAEQLCTERAFGYELGVKAAMLELILHLTRMQPQLPTGDLAGTARLKQVIDRIRRDYAQPLKVGDVARELGCSSSHFMRWFRQMTGSSFVAFLNDYRLTEAARQLRAGDEKILSIAQNVGFDSLSNFNRQFKLRYMMTPREYRVSR